MMAMIRCGENSLPMYCLGVLLSLIAHVILIELSASFAMQLAVSVTGIALMVLAATLLTWESRFDRPGPRLF
jgi:OpgC protein